MRPGVSEQLHRTTQVLREVVLPHVADPEARRAAESAAAGLALIAETWHRVLPFLTWDNAETSRLLRRLGEDPGTEEGDPLDVETVAARNQQLRERLEEHLTGGRGRADPDVLDHLDQRVRRYPLRYVPTLNTGSEE